MVVLKKLLKRTNWWLKFLNNFQIIHFTNNGSIWRFCTVTKSVCDVFISVPELVVISYIFLVKFQDTLWSVKVPATTYFLSALFNLTLATLLQEVIKIIINNSFARLKIFLFMLSKFKIVRDGRRPFKK
jgi:hypothetical protein